MDADQVVRTDLAELYDILQGTLEVQESGKTISDASGRSFFRSQVIFVDADQVVRTDLAELYDMDLKGAPLAYTPFCDNNKDMDGFRFWKQVRPVAVQKSVLSVR